PADGELRLSQPRRSGVGGRRSLIRRLCHKMLESCSSVRLNWPGTELRCDATSRRSAVRRAGAGNRIASCASHSHRPGSTELSGYGSSEWLTIERPCHLVMLHAPTAMAASRIRNVTAVRPAQHLPRD